MADAKVFISHAEEDHETAARICHALEAAKIPCWIAPRDIPPGANYLAGISEGLDGAQIVVVVMSVHANASTWVLREVENATHRNLTVIPLRLGQTAPSQMLGLLLSTRQWVDLGDRSIPEAMERVVDAVNGRATGRSSLDDLRSNDAALNLAAVTSIVGGLLVGAWGIYALLSAKGTCRFFGGSYPCSVGGGFLVVAAFCLLMCGASLWTRSRSAVPLAWLCVLLLVPGAIDGILYRYSGFTAPALGLGVAVPLAIAYTVTRRRRQFR
jgi:hypothetical protein